MVCMAQSSVAKSSWNCTEAGSYLRLIDSCITQLKVQGRSRTCNESKEEEGNCNPHFFTQSPIASTTQRHLGAREVHGPHGPEQRLQVAVELQKESSLLTTYWSESTLSS